MAKTPHRVLKQKPSIELLRELISYDPESGALHWKRRGEHLFSDGVLSARGAARIWNAQHAGESAFSCVSADGYNKGTIRGYPMSAHVVGFALFHGRYPAGPVAHMNGIGTDNRISNLLEGAAGRSRATAGVCFQGGRWVATITVQNRRHYLGRYPDRDTALVARRAAEIKFGFSGSRRAAPEAEGR